MRWARGLIVFVVLLAACGGGGDDSETSAEGGDDTTTTTVADTTDTTDGGGEGDDEPADTDTTDTTAAPSGGPATTRAPATTVPKAGGGEQPPGDGSGKPAAGTYRYRTTGTASFNGAPENIDETTDTKIEHLAGNKVRSTGEGQTTILEYTGAKILLHELKIDQDGFVRTFKAKPPVQWAPRPPTVGQKWNWTLTAQEAPTTIKQESVVDRTEKVTVGGTSYDTVVIKSKITFSGDVTGTVDLTNFIDLATGSPVRILQKGDISIGAAINFKSDTKSDFVSYSK